MGLPELTALDSRRLLLRCAERVCCVRHQLRNSEAVLAVVVAGTAREGAAEHCLERSNAVHTVQKACS